MRNVVGLHWFGAFWALVWVPTALPADRFDGFDAYVREAMQRWEIPGLAIAVVKDDKLVLARGYGKCGVGSDRLVTKDPPFSIAPCTKSFTAACIGMLGMRRRFSGTTAFRCIGRALRWPILTFQERPRSAICFV